jgi:hypothetical protein
MWKHNTAEIMGHPGTDADVFDTIVAFAKSIGMVALPLKKEQPSYIVNSLLVPLLGAGLDLLVRGKHLTGFSNTEEEAVGLTNVVPFLLEDELTKQGAQYSKGDDWSSYVKQDGLLITGQNPGSSEEIAKLLLETLKGKKKKEL